MKASTRPRHASNLCGQDFRADAANFPRLSYPIIDVHSHLFGPQAATVYLQAASDYGVELVYSMTPCSNLAAVAEQLGTRVQFIATPDILAKDRWHAFSEGYHEELQRFRAQGARIAKFWSAPRGIDFAEQAGAPPTAFRLDAPHVQKNMSAAIDLGMMIMVHVGDPDTWFSTKYANHVRYGHKADQYGPLEACLQRFDVPFIAAHMGGSPENLEFLGDLLARHHNLYVDTSATKWMVRELSRHSRDDLHKFFVRWQDRILFGSDIVVRDAHLSPSANDPEEAKSTNMDEAYDLYASRYWALRTLFETETVQTSPIADPDLQLVDPDRFGPLDAPTLRGFALPDKVVRAIYYENADRLLTEFS